MAKGARSAEVAASAEAFGPAILLLSSARAYPRIR
jgi:hypothetical protein